MSIVVVEKVSIHDGEPAIGVTKSDFMIGGTRIRSEVLKQRIEERFGKEVSVDCLLPFKILDCDETMKMDHGYVCSHCGKIQSWG